MGTQFVTCGNNIVTQNWQKTRITPLHPAMSTVAAVADWVTVLTHSQWVSDTLTQNSDWQVIRL